MDGITKAYVPTKHEVRVLKQYIDCGTANDTARELGLSRRTVEMHIENLRQKSGYRYIAQIVAFGYDNGWLSKGDGPKRKNVKIP